MTVVSVKFPIARDPSIVRLEFSDGVQFSFKTVYLSPDLSAEALVPGCEVSAEEAVSLRYAAACYRTERAALQLVARAEQTSFGITRKLEAKGHDKAQVRAVIAYLTGLEVVSDSRYAELWLQSHIRHPGPQVSPRRLQTKLCGRGISSDTARKALKTILDFETESTLLWNYVNTNHLDTEKKDPALKYLLKNEGFSAAAVQAFWEEL
ncbi:hypothetical protein FACS189483_08680 [Spirochaetia bacterium]|nr:hypothetical protein FACS189483_08680 [Spirochaetia bacterium]